MLHKILDTIKTTEPAPKGVFFCQNCLAKEENGRKNRT